MNYRGSYRHLKDNSKAALLSAIEIYNKPQIEYREECFVILLLNAWELLLKAMLSKKRIRIFYPKKRNQPYKTLSWKDALLEAEKFFPKDVDSLPVKRNLDLLSTYRDNAVHFYNQNEFFTIIYALAQTSIINYKDLLSKIFNEDLADCITWNLLPIGLEPPIDPITFISSKGKSVPKKKKNAVAQFLTILSESTDEIVKANLDTGRLLTIFNVRLESTKKIKKADFVVGITKSTSTDGPLTVVKTADPNVTHPLRRMEILEKLPLIAGIKLNSYVFQAIIWRYDIKQKNNYCWIANEGNLTKYSRDLITLLKSLSKQKINEAVESYRNNQKTIRKKKKKD
ncbi:MAG: DUF3644 domain-containing protein [bacterium]